jgi:hypothetical protein
MPRTAAQFLCALAADYLQPGNSKSFASLLKDAWAASGRVAVPERSLAETFATRPDLVDAWLRYSEDQRSRDAWYLASRRSHAGPERWLIGHPSLDQTREYGDRTSACAAFVARLLGRPYVLPDEP